MKILRLRLHNLNSLQGQTDIDFTDPVYADGLFAITGATGAGKTTLLDAICLALFHRTPRFDTLSATANPLMTEHTAECAAEVEFAARGRVFRARWSQRRARGKVGGKLQQPEVELAELLDGSDVGQVLTDRIRDKERLVEELSGLDYERFTRSVLLAQGGFAVFLNSADKERAALLEQLTGTEIYGQISMAVYAGEKQRRQALELLQAQASALPPVSDEQRQALQQHQEQLKQQVAQAQQARSHAQRVLAWRTALEAGSAALAEAEAGLAQAQQQVQADAPQRRRLQAAAPAQRAWPFWQAAQQAGQRLAQARQEQAQLMQTVQQRQQALAQSLAQALAAAGKAEQAAAAKCTQLRQRIASHADYLQVHAGDAVLGQQLPQWQQARSLWLAAGQRQLAAQQRLQASQQQAQQAAGLLAAAREQQQQRQQALPVLEQAVAEAQQALAGLLDGNSQASLAARREQLLEHWRERQAQLQWLQEQQRDQQQALDWQQALDDLAAEQQALAQAVAQAAQARQQAQDSAADKRRIVELQTRIASLAAHRSELLPDQPCPLCGSPQHPGVAGGDDASLRLARHAEAQARARLEDCEQAWQQRRSAEAALQARREARITQLDALRAQLEQRGQRIAAAGLSGVDADALQVQLADLLARGQALKQQLEQAAQLQLHVDQTQAQLLQQQLQWQAAGQAVVLREEACAQAAQAEAARQVESVAAACEVQQAEAALRGLLPAVPALAALEQSLSAWLQEREQAWEQWQVQHQQHQQLAASLADSEQAWQQASEELAHWQAQADVPLAAADGVPALSLEQARAAHALASQAVEQAQALRQQVEAVVAQRGNDEVMAQQALAQALQAQGLADLAQLQACYLPEEQANSLRHALHGHELALAQAQARCQQLAEGQAALSAQALSPLPQPALQAALEQAEQHWQALENQRGGVQAQLDEDDRRHAQRGQLQQRIVTDQAELAHWSRLSGLVGSADGARFRTFAQGLTLDRLVGLANAHLQRLDGGRYALQRSDAGLGLRVVDSWQADVVRDTRTLSGGESFLVSLALALGLSDLVSHRTRIESFFLDEGFGSLDPASLDIALDALDGLNAQGKLIGVISHVEAVKERIPVQISVRKTRGLGHSVVVLPCVERAAG